MNINLNDVAFARLTPHGVAVLMSHSTNIANECNMGVDAVLSTFNFNEVASTIEVPMWEMFNIFEGAHYMGNNNICFVDNCIEVTPL